MKKIVHLDDSEESRRMVRDSLSALRETSLTQYDSFYSFIHSLSNIADLYITDRHYPKECGGLPDDTSWRCFIKYVRLVSPESPIVMLSNSPIRPRFWARFPEIKHVHSKKNFVAEEFRDIVEYLLGAGLSEEQKCQA